VNNGRLETERFLISNPAVLKYIEVSCGNFIDLAIHEFAYHFQADDRRVEEKRAVV
jgi:hypothetical protein